MDFIIEHTTITFFSLGTILMLVLNLIRRRQYGQKGWQTFVFTALLVAVGMAGVRLLAILEHLDSLLDGYT